MRPVDCSAPEKMLAVAQGTAAGVPIDAISLACCRADAVLQLLQVQFESTEGRASDGVILNALSDVQGTIALISTLALHGYHSTLQANRQGGDQ